MIGGVCAALGDRLASSSPCALVRTCAGVSACTPRVRESNGQSASSDRPSHDRFSWHELPNDVNIKSDFAAYAHVLVTTIVAEKCRRVRRSGADQTDLRVLTRVDDQLV